MSWWLVTGSTKHLAGWGFRASNSKLSQAENSLGISIEITGRSAGIIKQPLCRHAARSKNHFIVGQKGIPTK
jgi:hypothetical protein